MPGEAGEVKGGELTGARLLVDLDPGLVQQGSHNVVAAGVGGEVDGGELALISKCWDQSILRFRWQGRLCVSWDVLEQLP